MILDNDALREEGISFMTNDGAISVTLRAFFRKKTTLLFCTA